MILLLKTIKALLEVEFPKNSSLLALASNLLRLSFSLLRIEHLYPTHENEKY